MVEVPWGPDSRPKRPIATLEPRTFRLETTTVWSFPKRGDWATHTADYRGNRAPEIPRNLILRYTQPGEVVLDPMVGGGTTLVECLLTGRLGIGVDIEPTAIQTAAANLGFGYWPIDWPHERPPIRLFVGDARRLDLVDDASVHLVTLHPPYADIIPYGGPSTNNLSRLRLEDFFPAMREVAAEAYRVLLPGRHCGVLIGDTRQHKHYVPISTRILQQFLDVGFILREDIIKIQHKMKSTREKWAGQKYDFYLIAHEHLYVFRKPSEGEKRSAYKHSIQWWQSPRERGDSS